MSMDGPWMTRVDINPPWQLLNAVLKFRLSHWLSGSTEGGHPGGTIPTPKLKVLPQFQPKLSFHHFGSHWSSHNFPIIGCFPIISPSFFLPWTDTCLDGYVAGAHHWMAADPRCDCSLRAVALWERHHQVQPLIQTLILREMVVVMDGNYM